MGTLTSKEFVTEYMKAYKNGVAQADLARSLGLSQATLSARKRRFISIGVELPQLAAKVDKSSSMKGNPNPGPVDVKELNKLIKELSEN